MTAVVDWQLESHLFNRSDVLVLFLDMDPSLNEVDLALPQPPGTSSVQAPQTRYEIVRTALRSFWTQKERTTSNLMRLSLAIYGVWDDVVELMPITSSAAGADTIDSALYQFLGEGQSRYQGSSPAVSTVSSASKSTKPSSFPFHDVGEVLKKITSDVEVAARDGHDGADYTVVQGVVLLSRPSTPPVNAAPAVPSQAGAKAHCILDVVCLCQLSQPSSAYEVVVQHNKDRNATSPSSALASAAGKRVDRTAERTATDVPCSVIDPVAFTGIAHKGLAVGPSLTKLLCVHEPHAKAFLATPLTLIDIPVASEAVPATRPPASPSKAASRRSSAPATEALDPSGFTRVRGVASIQNITSGNYSGPDLTEADESPPQNSLSPSRTHNSGSSTSHPTSTTTPAAAGAAGSRHQSPGRRGRHDGASGTSFSEVGRQRSAASVTFGAGDKDGGASAAGDSEFTPVKRAETTSGATAHGTPHEPRPPATGDAPAAPARMAPHKSAPSHFPAKRPAASRAALTTSASDVSADTASASGPSPPAGPRLRPQARVNSLTTEPSGANDSKSSAPAAAAASNQNQPSGRLPPRVGAGSARVSPTTTLNQRVTKDG